MPSLSLAQPAGWLSGRVLGPGGGAEAGARIQVTGEGGETAETRTDSAGRYRVALPGSRGSFVVSVAAAGRTSRTRIVSRATEGTTLLVADFALELAAVPLPPLTVRVTRLSVAEATRWTPGSVDQSRAGIDMRREPLGSDELAELTAREVGVVRAPSAEGAGFSIAGQPADQTRLTLDGADFGVTVPREAVRSVGVLTNTFDVSRGRFTGGQVDVATLPGGSAWGGTVRAHGRGRWLQYGGAPPPFSRPSSTLTLDAGGGGPLVRERLFLFGALTLRSTEAAGQSLDEASQRTAARLSVPVDSLDRFLRITAPYRPANRVAPQQSRLATGLLRLDAVLSSRHALLVRLNGQVARASDGGAPTAVPGTGTGSDAVAVGALAELNSGGRVVANRLRLHVSVSARDWWSEDEVPFGQVSVASASAGGPGFAVLRFAGNPLSPRDTRQRLLLLSDEVVVTTRNRDHRFRMGIEGALEANHADAGVDPGGFFFGSLADLEAGRPSLFTRSLGSVARRVESRRASVFADHQGRIDGLQFSYGVRAERVAHVGGTTPDRDAISLPGVPPFPDAPPGRVAAPWRLSPRVGFAFEARMPWDRGPEGRTAFQGGIGEFVGVLPLAPMALALSEDGRTNPTELVCPGPSAPTPDWAAYRTDVRRIPTSCRDAGSAFAGRLAPVTIFGRDFSPPRVWRASLNAQGLLPNGVIWHLTTAYVRGDRQPGAIDRNLRSAPAFVNAHEGGRSVYADVASIDTATGAIAATASRIDPRYGTVRELSRWGRSRTLQGSASIGRLVGFSYLQLGYTWTDSRETTSPFGGPAVPAVSTGTDAFSFDMAPASHTPRHMLLAFLDWRRSNLLSIGFRASLSSGMPFTPTVSGDVNGDGASNDRAFVYDPGAVHDPTMADGMERVLREAPAGARRCLRAQLGRIAEHNSCRTGWTPSLDVNARLTLGPSVEGIAYRRVMIWIVAHNVTAALDRMLHGRDDLRGWGQIPAVDDILLSVRGFDADARAFRYDINPRFGRPTAQTVAGYAPFSISIQARVAIGSDRVVTEFHRRQAGDRNEALSPAELRLHLRSQLPNAPAEILALDAPRQLHLTPDQARRLQAAADSVNRATTPLLDEMVDAIFTSLSRAGRRDNERVRTLAQAARQLRTTGFALAREILTPDQWARLPESLREPDPAFVAFPPERLTSPPLF